MTETELAPDAAANPDIDALAGIGRWTWDIEAGTMSWSSHMYTIFDVEPNTSMAPLDMLRFRRDPADGDEAHILRDALRHGKSWATTHPAVTSTGRLIVIRSVGVVEMKAGRSCRMHGLVQDVTGEHELGSGAERDRILLESVSDLSGVGRWEYEPASNRVSWSKQTRRIYEVGDTFVPTPESLKPLFTQQGLQIQDECIQRAIASGAPAACEIEAKTQAGRPILVRSICKVEQRKGEVVRITGIVQDITRQREIEETLGRAERLLEDVSSMTGVGGWEVPLSTGEMFWTRQVRRIFEVDDTFEPASEALSQFMDAGELVRVEAAVADAARNGSPVAIEFSARTSSGRPIRLRSVGRREVVGHQPARIVGALEDVTAQRQDEAERRRDEALNEQVSRLSGIGGWEFNINSKETTWSPQVRKIYEVDEAFNPTLEDHAMFVAPESAEAVKQARRRALVEGVPVELEFQAMTAQGRRIWVRNVYQTERVGGRAVRMFGTAQDVTSERLLQDRMDRLNARMSDAIDAAELRIWDIDLASGVLSWDPQKPPVFAPSVEEPRVGAVTALGFIHPEDRAKFEQQVGRVTASGEPTIGRIRTLAPDGSYRNVEVRMRLSSDRVSSRKILGVSRDVTREVLMTEELVRKRREAEESSLAKTQFVARMSHEIRTPMNGVIGMLEVLRRAEADAVKGAHVTTALKSARDLMSVLDDVIDVSQLESRHLSLENSPYSIRNTVEDVVALFASLAREKAITLSAVVEAAVPDWVMGDPRRLRQVLTNLVGNAIKFTPSGAIDVSAGYDAEQAIARFEVRDTGEGISEESASKVFDLFYQADSAATRKHGGSGLGLAISKQLVGMMGGQIEVESQVGLGSTFSFTIMAPATIALTLDNDETQPGSMPPLRVLVAEDNPAMQQILRALLEAGGHELTIVSDGRAAVAAAASGTFDVILMDVMMPVMDGPTATQRIRELGGRAGGIPIVALTANALVGDRARYLEIGMTDYLSKPIDVEALLSLLARIARQD